MLQIEIDNQYLDLSNDTKITFELKNPMFEDVGSYSFPFSIPATDHNLSLLNFPNRQMKVINQESDINAKILFDGIVIFEGLFSIEEFKDNQIEVFIKSGKGEWNYLIKDKKLKDVNFGKINLSSMTLTQILDFLLATINSQYPDNPFVLFPVYNNSAFLHYQNVWQWNESDSEFDFDKALHVTPFFYLNYYILNIFSLSGFRIEYNELFNNAELNSLIIYNQFNIRQDANHFIDFIAPENHVPNILIKDFINNLESYLNFTCFVDNRNKSVSIFLNNSIIQSINYIDITEFICKSFLIKQPEFFDGLYIEQKPDSNDSFWSSEITDIEYNKKYNFLDEVSTYSELPLTPKVNDVVYVIDENNYYQFITSWILLSSDKQINKFFSKHSQDEIKSECSTLLMDEQSLEPSADPIAQAKVPRSDIIVDSNFISPTEFSLRLLFYRGLKDNELSDLYPYGSSDNLDYSGNPAGLYSLNLHSNSGMYQNFFKSYLYWKYNIKREVEFYAIFSVSFLSNIKFYNKYRIDNVNYLLKSLTVTLSNNSISTTKCEAFIV